MLIPFSSEDLGRIFDARTLTKGRSLILLGAVEVSLADPSITAVVDHLGLRRTVTITPSLLGRRVVFINACSCGQPACLHLAATGLAALDRFPVAAQGDAGQPAGHAHGCAGRGAPVAHLRAFPGRAAACLLRRCLPDRRAHRASGSPRTRLRSSSNPAGPEFEPHHGPAARRRNREPVRRSPAELGQLRAWPAGAHRPRPVACHRQDAQPWRGAGVPGQSAAGPAAEISGDPGRCRTLVRRWRHRRGRARSAAPGADPASPCPGRPSPPRAGAPRHPCPAACPAAAEAEILRPMSRPSAAPGRAGRHAAGAGDPRTPAHPGAAPAQHRMPRRFRPHAADRRADDRLRL